MSFLLRFFVHVSIGLFDFFLLIGAKCYIYFREKQFIHGLNMFPKFMVCFLTLCFLSVVVQKNFNQM